MIIRKKGPQQQTIQIEEHFRASREKVFKAWTDPESLKKWFLAEDNVVVQDVSLELSVGGHYEIKVIYPGYAPTPISGEFMKIRIPETLEYSWHTPVLGEKKTKVEVHFSDLEKGSCIHLTHGEFATAEEMQLHIEGWKGCLTQLQTYLNT